MKRICKKVTAVVMAFIMVFTCFPINAATYDIGDYPVMEGAEEYSVPDDFITVMSTTILYDFATDEDFELVNTAGEHDWIRTMPTIPSTTTVTIDEDARTITLTGRTNNNSGMAISVDRLKAHHAANPEITSYVIKVTGTLGTVAGAPMLMRVRNEGWAANGSSGSASNPLPAGIGPQSSSTTIAGGVFEINRIVPISEIEDFAPSSAYWLTTNASEETDINQRDIVITGITITAVIDCCDGSGCVDCCAGADCLGCEYENCPNKDRLAWSIGNTADEDGIVGRNVRIENSGAETVLVLKIPGNPDFSEADNVALKLGFVTTSGRRVIIWTDITGNPSVDFINAPGQVPGLMINAGSFTAGTHNATQVMPTSFFYANGTNATEIYLLFTTNNDNYQVTGNRRGGEWGNFNTAELELLMPEPPPPDFGVRFDMQAHIASRPLGALTTSSILGVTHAGNADLTIIEEGGERALLVNRTQANATRGLLLHGIDLQEGDIITMEGNMITPGLQMRIQPHDTDISMPDIPELNRSGGEALAGPFSIKYFVTEAVAAGDTLGLRIIAHNSGIPAQYTLTNLTIYRPEPNETPVAPTGLAALTPTDISLEIGAQAALAVTRQPANWSDRGYDIRWTGFGVNKVTISGVGHTRLITGLADDTLEITAQLIIPGADEDDPGTPVGAPVTFNVVVGTGIPTSNRITLDTPDGRDTVFHLSDISPLPPNVVDIEGLQDTGGTLSFNEDNAISMVTDQDGYAGNWNGLDVVPSAWGVEVGDVIEIVVQLAELFENAVNGGFRIGMPPSFDSTQAWGDDIRIIEVGESTTFVINVTDEFLAALEPVEESVPRFRIAGDFANSSEDFEGLGGAEYIIHDILVHREAATEAEVTFSVDGDNGTLSATVNETAITSGDMVEIGASVTFTAAPQDGYEVSSWTVNGVAQTETGETITIAVPSTGLTVAVAFAETTGETFTVTWGENIYASIVPDVVITSPYEAASGAEIVFAAVLPQSGGYSFPASWTVNDVAVTGTGENNETLALTITEDTNIEVSFVSLTAQISVDIASDFEFDDIAIHSDGTYDPPQIVTVTVTNTGSAETGDLTVALSGDSAFTLSAATLDTLLPTETTTFTVSPNATGLTEGTYNATVTISNANVSASFNISVVAAPYNDSAEVVFTAGENGTISAAINGTPIESGDTVLVDSNVDFTATPNEGYQVASWTVNGEIQIYNDTGEIITGNEFMVGVPNAGLNVSVAFKEITGNAQATLEPLTTQMTLPENYTAEDFEPVIYIISNTGNETINNLRVELSGANADAFVISQILSVLHVAPSETASFDISPIIGLGIGSYTATVTVSADEINDLTATVTLTINESGTVTHAVTFGDNIQATVNGAPLASGTAVNNGTEVVFTATPPSGFTFPATWTVNGAPRQENNETLTLTITQDTTVGVSFTPVSDVRSISLSVTGTHVFNQISLNEDGTYSTPETLTVTVTNTGNVPTGTLFIGIDGMGGGAGNFTASPHSIALDVGGTDTFTVTPNATGILAGTHLATVFVSGTGIDESFDISVTATGATPVTSISVTPDSHAFAPLPVGYTASDLNATAFMVTNTGNTAISNISITTVSFNNAFVITPQTFDLAVGGTQYIEVIPATSLSVGNYATEMRFGTGMTIFDETVSLSFEVTAGLSQPQITTIVLPEARLNQPYSFQMQGANGTTWSATGLPTGLSISQTGLISGTPTAVGSFNPQITLTGATGTTPAVRPFALTVTNVFVVEFNSAITATLNGVPITSGTTVPNMSTVVFTATTVPQGQQVDGWYIDGVIAQVGGLTFSTIINNALNLSVTFKNLPSGTHNVTWSTGMMSATIDGTVVEPGPINENAQITFVSNTPFGHRVSVWRINNEVVANETGATLTRTVTGDMAVTVEFVVITANVRFSVTGAGGTITARVGASTIDSNSTHNVGTQVAFIATANTGQRVSGWMVNGQFIPGPVATITRIVPVDGLDVTVSFQAVPANAHISFEVTNTNAIQAGSAVMVDVRISNNPGFATMPIRINVPQGLSLIRYDVPQALRQGFSGPQGTTPGLTITGGGLTGVVNVHMAWFRTENFTDNGTILSLTFAVDAQATPGNYTLASSFTTAGGVIMPPTDRDGRTLPISIENGLIVVEEGTSVRLGDVNGNGQVDFNDAVLIARFLVGHTGLENLEGVVNFDITRGMVTPGSVEANHVRLIDATVIARFLAGHPGVSLGAYPVPQ